MNADFPEWAGRQLLAEALRAVGLPVAVGAMYRRPRDTMTMPQRLQAIEVADQVRAEASRRLPPGVSGAVLMGEWREAAWRCTVAGLALLDAEAREQIVGPEPAHPRRGETMVPDHNDPAPKPALPVVQAEPVAVAVAEPVAGAKPVVLKMPTKSAIPIRFKWEGRRRG